MFDHIGQIVGVIGWFVGSFALASYVGKREIERALDPVAERARAEKITLALGGWLVWALLAVAFLSSLASAIWVFIGLATGANLWAIATMAAVMAISLPTFFYLERILKTLSAKNSGDL